MEILKLGDKIEWSFPDDHQSPLYRGKTYSAKIAMVDDDNECYGVYAEYGQDLIPFDQAKLIKPTTMSADAKEYLKNQELFDVDEIFNDKSLANAIGAIMESYAREYHRQQIHEKLDEINDEFIENAFKNTATHSFYVDGWKDGVNWLLNHLKETNKG